MSMFDYVKYKNQLYQTKDFRNLMEIYTITENGRLVVDKTHLEIVPENERPYPNAESILKMAGMFKTIVDEKDVDLNYSGTINFYDFDSTINQYIDYEAKFVDGTLVKIEKRSS